MRDDFASQPVARSRSGMLIATVGLIAFVLGAALVGWLGWSGKLAQMQGYLDPSARPVPAASAPALPPPGSLATVSPDVAVVGFDQRLAALEQRLARIDFEADTASGNFVRTEGLLVAFATRRAVERGDQLGELEGELRARFGTAQPQAVQTIILAARQPTSLDRLDSQLDALGPQLTGANDSGWASIRRQMAQLFTVRRDGNPSPAPRDRLAHARLLLRSGQYAAAADEVARLPGADVASDWIAAARRFGAAERALDQIERTALLDPAQLGGGAVDTPKAVPQPDPAATPPATSAP